MNPVLTFVLASVGLIAVLLVCIYVESLRETGNDIDADEEGDV